ncbi:hypothetical protein CRE_29242 [Caenorhabditis remanei]|uniref:Uncharacterized protein n=1 Tax=Caenorhabditis remanei TaxID=31234 RepID=E3NLR7_CAERE|nr:hypothetical protein CRE_29242 [Caenorhabditis remanei]
MESGAPLAREATFDRVEKKRTIAEEIDEMMKYYAFDDAIFLAEIYYETDKTNGENHSDALLTYADCLYRANKKEECYGLLRSTKFTGARLHFLFARVAYDLNKFDECRGALFEHENGNIRKEILEDARVAAHANLLNAQMLCDENHMDLAVESCQKSLDENIFLWAAVITYLRFGGQELAQTFDRHKDKSNGITAPPSPTVTMRTATPSPTGPSTSASSAPSTAPPAEPIGSSSRRSSVSTTRRSARSATTTTSSANREIRSMGDSELQLRSIANERVLGERGAEFVLFSRAKQIFTVFDLF